MNRLFYMIVMAAGLFIWQAAPAGAQDIIALGGSISADKVGNGAGESVEKLIDGDVNTKYLTFGGAPVVITWTCTTPQTAGIYTVTSANDAAERDPKRWTFEGSANGTAWTVLDSRSDEFFPDRFMTKAYFFSNNTAYKYYRFNVAENNGAALFQLAEFGINTAAVPAAPTALSGIASSGAEVALTWTDNSVFEASVEVERSANGTDYDKIGVVGVNQTRYVDERASVNTQFYYRVRARNVYGYSPYSNVRTVTTLNYSGALKDLTDDGGTLTVDKENANTSEASPRLIDNNYGTKYLIPSGNTFPYTLQYQSTSGSSMLVTKYVLVSGNDAPSRDPKTWTFQGSNNGTSWTTLDTRPSETFAGRGLAKSFILTTPASYVYYKIVVTANGGASIPGQIAEWEIWGLDPAAPAAPDALTATAVSKVEIDLTWSDNASNESGYEIERSTNDITFIPVKTLDPGATSYADNTLTPATRYYYRIRAIGAAGASVYSNVANDSTLYDPNLPLPPVNLQATTDSDTQISLVWEDRSENETGFRVQRSKDGTLYSTIGSVAANAEAYTDATGTLGTRYYYRILAFNDVGPAILYSNIAEAVTTGANQPPTLNDLDDVVTCNTTDVHTVQLAVSPGPETYQAVTLTAETDNDDLIETLSVGQVVDGIATLSYKIHDDSTGTATITVVAKDDGGDLNGGSDVYAVSFTVEAYEIGLEVTSDAPDTPIARGSYVHLTATSDEAEHFEWQAGPGIVGGRSTAVLTVHPTQGYEYTVVATTSAGCERQASIQLLIEGDFALDPGNMLTPTRRDGKNDVWVIWNLHTFPGNVVRVFDQSGREVFRQKDYTNDWDGTYRGTPLAEGVYYYVIDLGSGIENVQGSLTILHDQ